MTTRKARPKQIWRPPTAADHNAMAAAADMHRRGPDATPERQQPVNANVVTVKNTSGSDKRQYEVCELTRSKVLTTLVREQTRFTGNDPWQGGMTWSKYLPRHPAVFLEPCPANKYAQAQVAGVCPALVYVNSADDHFCEIAAAEDRLISTEAGSIPILQKPSGATGEQLCLVNLSWQEECHLVGVPVGDGITACNWTTPGTGVVQVYFYNSATGLTAASESGNPVYLTVYSLYDDPILPNTSHVYQGTLYPAYGNMIEFVLLHRDMFGTWWIDPLPHAKVGMLHLAGDYASISYPATPTDYLLRDTALGDGGTGLTNLDTSILQAYGAPADAADGVATVLLTGDYTCSLSWFGGIYTSADAPAISAWGYLGFAQVTLTLQYLPPGGDWTTLLTSPANRHTERAGQYPDVTGGSYTKSVNLIAGSLLRCSAAIGAQYPSGTPTLALSDLKALVNLVKHA